MFGQTAGNKSSADDSSNDDVCGEDLYPAYEHGKFRLQNTFY